MNPKQTKKGNKKGLSPMVVILLVTALLSMAILVVHLYPQNQKDNSDTPNNSASPPPIPPSSTTDIGENDSKPPESSPNTDINYPKLSVTPKRVHLNSGGEVSYGYPMITLPDAPDVAIKINEQLKNLVEDKILPVIDQMATEDNPEAYRSYSFTLSEGNGYYSVIVTVDISEGITPAREIYGWSFLADSGELLQLNTHCTNKKVLATVIDGCIKNVSAYDQIIHQWLTDVVTNEHESNEFSFYFEEENMIAVLNKHLRLNSYDRDPILITVPYTKISSLFVKESCPC